MVNLAVDGGAYLIDIERSGDEIVLAVLREVPPSAIASKGAAVMHECSAERGHPFLLQAASGATMSWCSPRASSAPRRGSCTPPSS